LTSRRGQGGGPAPQVGTERWEAWREHLQGQQAQHWTSEQLAEVFEQFTGVRYSPGHWCGLLRHQQGMYYYKPRPRDYRRADDAQQQLRTRIQATFDALWAMGYQPGQVGWGFADEVAAQLHSNNARFWAFEPNLSRVVNTDRGSRSFFGFYGVNAQSHLAELADGKVESIKQALLEVKARQTDCQALVIFWDNASTHKCLETWGWERRIFFVPLPTYSPQLNPIEQVWKSVKRWLNQTQFVKKLDELGPLFRQGFAQFKDQLSFTASWWEKYHEDLSWYHPIFESESFQ
jgi:putative transposase